MQNNKIKISAPIWNDKFDLLDGSYSISEIQDYFEYIVKKTWNYSKQFSCASTWIKLKPVLFCKQK